MKIEKRYLLEGSDGVFRKASGFPHGVTYTGNRKPYWVTCGRMFYTLKEAETYAAKHQEKQRAIASLYQLLDEVYDHGLTELSNTWTMQMNLNDSAEELVEYTKQLREEFYACLAMEEDHG